MDSMVANHMERMAVELGAFIDQSDKLRQSGKSEAMILNVYQISIYIEEGCDFALGEFDVSIEEIEQGWVGREDWQLVQEFVSNEFSSENFPTPGVYLLTVQEVIENLHPGWDRYYQAKEGSVLTLAPEVDALGAVINV